MSEKLPTKKDSSIEGKKPKEYPREFFELQIIFAQKVAHVLNIPISQALLEYTNFYRRFNLGRKPDANNPIWQEFISSIADENLPEKTYELYLKRKNIELEKGPHKKKFGCFTCEYKPEEESIRVHFSNEETNGSPFDDKNLSKRLKELKSMFEYVKSTYPQAKIVKGNSWLYNLSKYRRFFPPEYTRNPNPTSQCFTGLSGWGQFLDNHMKIKQRELHAFQERLGKAQSMDEVLDSLPLRTFRVETKIEDFYKFYDI